MNVDTESRWTRKTYNMEVETLEAFNRHFGLEYGVSGDHLTKTEFNHRVYDTYGELTTADFRRIERITAGAHIVRAEPAMSGGPRMAGNSPAMDAPRDPYAELPQHAYYCAYCHEICDTEPCPTHGDTFIRTEPPC